MNTKVTLSTLLTTGALLMLGIQSAQAQDAMYSDQTAIDRVNQGYVRPNRRKIGRPRARLHPKLEAYEGRLNQLGFTLTRPNDSWSAVPSVAADTLRAQIDANKLAGYYDTSGSASQTIYDTYVKAFEAGDTDSLWGKATFSVTHTGSLNLARVQAEGRIEGALFGNIKTIGLATADVYAPLNGTQSAAFQLSVMGQTVWSKNASGASVNLNDGKDWTARLWQTGFSVDIAGYGLGAEVWLEGTVGAHYSVTATPRYAYMGANAGADIAFGGRAWANLGIVNAHLDAKLKVIDVLASTEASTKVASPRPEMIGATMTAHRYIGVDVDFLSGYAKVKVTEPFFDSTLGSWTLWNDPDGIFQLHGVLENYTRSYHLGGGLTRK